MNFIENSISFSGTLDEAVTVMKFSSLNRGRRANIDGSMKFVMKNIDKHLLDKLNIYFKERG